MKKDVEKDLHLFAGKSDRDGSWETVVRHLSDTAGVMGCLCDHWISPEFVSATGLSYDVFRAVCVFLAYTHDIGKLTSAFQGRIASALPGLIDRLQASGFDIVHDDESRKTPHAVASAAIMHEIFKIEATLCEVIASHHGRPRGTDVDDGFHRQMGRFQNNYYGKGDQGKYVNLWTCVYEEAVRESGITDYPQLSVQAQMLLSGLLIMADWIASNSNYFPLQPCWEDRTIDEEARIESGWRRVGIESPWLPSAFAMGSTEFRMRFGFCPNDIQMAAIEAASQPGTRMMVIEASMGKGKTEAALASAEIMAAQAGSGGVFIGLPTQATANGMFPRVYEWAARASANLGASIRLAHSSAAFNKDYELLRTHTNDETGLTVNEWMSGRHRTLLPDFVVGTVDQVLMAALRRKFVMLLHAGMAGKTVIIDEVHSYDSYMSQYLYTVMAWLGAYRTPVILLSATLTEAKRQELFKAYLGRKMVATEVDKSYPCVTWTDGTQVFRKAVTTDLGEKKTYHIRYGRKSDAGTLLGKGLDEGGCAGIILNTVESAQSMARHLKETLPAEFRVILIHARFLPSDRSELENQVIGSVGKGSGRKERDRVVVVGTQVLEQSLDLDFDLLMTDPCPIDLLFQRIGREHRHPHARPGKLQEAECIIFSEDDSLRSASRIYSEYLIRSTLRMLETATDLHVPDDIRDMVGRVYDSNTAPGDAGKEGYLRKTGQMVADSYAYRIPDPYGCDFRGFLDAEAETGETDEEGVRYGMDSFNVLLLERRRDGSIATLDGLAVIQGGCIPDCAQTPDILSQVLSLPAWMLPKGKLIDDLNRMNVCMPGWKENPALRYSNIVLLDERGCVELCGLKFKYTKEYGFQKEGK